MVQLWAIPPRHECRGLLALLDETTRDNDVPPLQQEIERILDSLLIGEVEPEDDEILLIAKYQDQKKNGTLILHEIEKISGYATIFSRNDRR